MEGEVEYLSEWPVEPRSGREGPSHGDSTSEVLTGGPAAKRPKREIPATQLPKASVSCDLGQKELTLACSDPSALAGSLLARWWKLKLRTRADTRQIDSRSQMSIDEGVPASSNPNTLLYHIARYIAIINICLYSLSTSKCDCLYLQTARSKEVPAGTSDIP